MPFNAVSPGLGLGDELDGCSYILAEGRFCDDRAVAGSSYCSKHHAMCYLPRGSSAERRRESEMAILARKVGGRRSNARGPSRDFLRKLDEALDTEVISFLKKHLRKNAVQRE